MAIKGYWRLNGNSAASVGSNGTDTNMSYSSKVGINGVGRFNGTSSFISLGTQNPLPNGRGVVSVWFTNMDVTAENYVIAKGADNDLYAGNWGIDIIPIPATNSLHIYLLYGFARWVSIFNIPNYDYTKLNNVTIILKENQQKIFFNSVLVGEGALSTAAPTASAPMVLGKQSRSAPYTYFTKGDLDEVKLDTTEWGYAQVKNEYSRIKGFF